MERIYKPNFGHDGDTTTEVLRGYDGEFGNVFDIMKTLGVAGSPTPPPDPTPYLLWLDTSNPASPVLKMWNGSSWVDNIRVARATNADSATSADDAAQLGGVAATRYVKLTKRAATEWTALNPILAVNEEGLETDTRKSKFGDGENPWVSLPYNQSPGGGTPEPGEGIAWSQITDGTPADNAALMAEINTRQALVGKNVAGGYPGLDENEHISNAQIPTNIQRTSEKGVADGYASLDAGAKVPDAQIPDSIERTSHKNAANGYPGLGPDGKIPASVLPEKGSLRQFDLYLPDQYAVLGEGETSADDILLRCKDFARWRVEECVPVAMYVDSFVGEGTAADIVISLSINGAALQETMTLTNNSSGLPQSANVSFAAPEVNFMPGAVIEIGIEYGADTTPANHAGWENARISLVGRLV